MLVLMRRVGEVIRIGDDVQVKVSEVNCLRVRLAIEAPRSIPVDRKEVHERKQQGIKSKDRKRKA